MHAFFLKNLRVLSSYFGSDLQNFRRTSSSWNPILSSRKLHDASSAAPSVDNKFKLLDFTSTRQKELTVERKQLCESQSDGKTQISDVLKNIDIRWFVGNFKVEHIITMMENLHGEILPTSSMYEKLVLNCCALDKVDVAIDVVDKMCEAGFTLSSHVMQSVLETCSETDQHFRVFEIYSIISRHPHHFELNEKICRLLVHCCVVMKDFECAYKMVNELQKKYFKYKTTMYNAIMAGYFFEKNISGGLRVLEQMRDANVKLDSYTFSYLIGNCETKEEIKKYYEEMEQSGIHLTKEVFVALIHAYATCVEDYEEQDVLWNLHGELERVLLLLKELSGQDWVDGCRWAIRYSVQNKNLSSTIELFKQLNDYYKNEAPNRRDPLYYYIGKSQHLFDNAYYVMLKFGPTYLRFGLDLLDLIKKELDLDPSKMCLDILLSLCAISRDVNNAKLVWREYVLAERPYDELSYMSMYQVLLESGDYKSADIFLNEIPSVLSGFASDMKKHYFAKMDDVLVSDTYDW